MKFAGIKYGYKTLIIAIIIVSLILTIVHALIYEKLEFEIYRIALHGLAMTTFIWVGCMAIVRALWHYFPWEHKPLKHLILELILIISYTVTIGFLAYTLQIKFGLVPEGSNINLGREFADLILITLLISTIHEAIFFYKQWKINFSKSVKLEKDNIEAKYETLKSQINPHFLFNSLNSLTHIVDDNEEATSYIQDLSEFLRYVLKSRDRELVLVREEIKVLKRYLSLQKTRFRNNLIIKLNVDEKHFHYSLPPLVLQMLVENCIKHNVISKEKPLTISISAKKETISVENNLQKKATELSTEQGLRNISDRFAFFTNQQVQIIETNQSFKVKIPLLLVEV